MARLILHGCDNMALRARPIEALTLPSFGNMSAPVLIVCDPVIGNLKATEPLTGKQMKFLIQYLKEAGFQKDDVQFLSCSTPVSAETWEKQKALGEHLKSQRDLFAAHVRDRSPSMIISMGKSAATQIFGRATQITKVRGLPVEIADFDNAVCVPAFSPGHVLRQPDNIELFKADIMTAGRIKANNYSLAAEKPRETNYRWCTDIQFLLDNPPEYLCVDTETLGTRYYDPGCRLLTVQLSWAPGEAVILPIDYNPWHKNTFGRWAPNGPVNQRVRTRLQTQLKALLENPDVKVFGHNYKYDYHWLEEKLGIVTANYNDDTQLLSHAIDENMISHSLADCVRRWVPRLSGYSDEFDRDPVHRQKTRMDLVPPRKMLAYGCGDVDSCFSLRPALRQILDTDKKQRNSFENITMRACRAFADFEDNGFRVDRAALSRLKAKVEEVQGNLRRELLASVHPKIAQEHGVNTNPAKLSNPSFLRAWLFTHPRGLKLEAVEWTKSTAKEKDKSKRVPSVSTKTHLPFFNEHDTVEKLIKYLKNEKLLTTYIGDPNEGNGFWQYIFGGRIRPSYRLDGTVTGRTSSNDPNGQNFPQRGEFAKEYRSIFIADDGYVLIEADFSQIELRVVAIMANEPTMLRLYREGADIHTATACYVNNLTLEQFKEKTKDEQKQLRFQAKAVNFGFIYGMGWRKFKNYARTEYGLKFTDEQAQQIRQAFFKLYRNLPNWHENTKTWVEENGYVRSLDGRIRHLGNAASDDDGVASSAERQGINAPVQCFANNLGMLALARINAEVDPALAQVVGFIHDAIILKAPRNRAIEACRVVKQYMESNPLEELFNFKSPIPLIADASVGLSLSNMAELNDIDGKWVDDTNLTSWEDLLRKIAANPDPKKAAEAVKLNGGPVPLVKRVGHLVRRPVMKPNLANVCKPKVVKSVRTAA